MFMAKRGEQECSQSGKTSSDITACLLTNKIINANMRQGTVWTDFTAKPTQILQWETARVRESERGEIECAVLPEPALSFPSLSLRHPSISAHVSDMLSWKRRALPIRMRWCVYEYGSCCWMIFHLVQPLKPKIKKKKNETEREEPK